MAPVSVRYHLDILQGDNLIEVSKVRREGSVGRPQQLYGLTREANDHFPDNFAALTNGLVRQMKKALSPEEVEAAFCALAREIAQGLPAANDDSIEDRLGRVAEFLNERGYFARWEKEEIANQEGADAPAAGESYLLHTFNCPYAGVSSEHRELCLMDQELVNELMGQPCQRIESLAEDGTCCTYRIAEDHSSSPTGGEAIASEIKLLV